MSLFCFPLHVINTGRLHISTSAFVLFSYCHCHFMLEDQKSTLKLPTHKMSFGACFFFHFLFPQNVLSLCWTLSYWNKEWIETQFIGVEREMKRSERSMGAIARSSAAYREYNNIIFRFWESTADYELSLETTGDRRLSLAPTFWNGAKSSQ